MGNAECWDKDLYYAFKNDFEGWTEQCFQRLEASTRQDFRNLLRRQGVFVPVSGSRIAGVLTNLLISEEMPVWPGNEEVRYPKRQPRPPSEEEKYKQINEQMNDPSSIQQQRDEARSKRTRFEQRENQEPQLFQPTMGPTFGSQDIRNQPGPYQPNRRSQQQPTVMQSIEQPDEPLPLERPGSQACRSLSTALFDWQRLWIK